MSEGNATRVAKNSVFMFIRMLVLMLVSLYTSRILLQYIGINDYGLYNVVGSVITMFASLRSLFTSSTQRFLNYEMGKGNTERLQMIFSMSVLITAILAFVFVVVSESFGLWYIDHKINVDPDRIFAAKMVLHYSVASAVVIMFTVPYDAVIVANEHMGVYAILSVIEAVLKLLVIFLLSLWGGDKLIFYAFLLLIVQIVIRFVNIIYCKIHFKECKFRRTWDKDYFKSMFSFAGWNFAANTGYALSHEGINFAFNAYGGVVVNAARGIAYQIKGALQQIVNNVNVAINPFAIKVYARDEKEKFYDIMFFSSKTNAFLASIVSLPLCVFIQPIVNLWLGFIPEYSINFIRLILLYEIFHSLIPPIERMFFAANKIKWFQLSGLLMHILILGLSILTLANGGIYISVLIIMICHMLVSILWFTQLAGKQLSFPVRPYLKKVLLHVILYVLTLFIPFYFYENYFSSSNILMLILNGVFVFLIAFIGGIFLLYSHSERKIIMNVVTSLLKINN